MNHECDCLILAGSDPAHRCLASGSETTEELCCLLLPDLLTVGATMSCSATLPPPTMWTSSHTQITPWMTGCFASGQCTQQSQQCASIAMTRPPCGSGHLARSTQRTRLPSLGLGSRSTKGPSRAVTGLATPQEAPLGLLRALGQQLAAAGDGPYCSNLLVLMQTALRPTTAAAAATAPHVAQCLLRAA